jgi:DNA-binding response OmpR family regulator
VSKPLSDTIILVADDQPDVVRTLCQPLHKAGASLRYVADAHAALAELAAHPVDLILADMKMPPEEWGGLWLLRELRNGGWATPVVALSGEGSKRQVIEAQRLGANSWVDKDLAGEELLEQCAALLTDSFGQALDLASLRLPTPLAYRFARYARMTDPDRRKSEGLHVLEAVLRFSALLGLSSTPPQPLPGITTDKVRTPSMRTWFDLCRALARTPGAGTDFTRLLSFLIPDPAHNQLITDLISLRNDIAHGRAIPDDIPGPRLDILLRRFAHRAQSAWRANIAVPMSMTYDGSSYRVEVLRLSGPGAPRPDAVKSPVPIVTGELILLSPEAKPLPLAPWLIARGTDDPAKLHCLLFDGLQYTKGKPAADTPLKYSKAYGRSDRGSAPLQPQCHLA